MQARRLLLRLRHRELVPPRPRPLLPRPLRPRLLFAVLALALPLLQSVTLLLRLD